MRSFRDMIFAGVAMIAYAPLPRRLQAPSSSIPASMRRCRSCMTPAVVNMALTCEERLAPILFEVASPLATRSLTSSSVRLIEPRRRCKRTDLMETPGSELSIASG